MADSAILSYLSYIRLDPERGFRGFGSVFLELTLHILFQTSTTVTAAPIITSILNIPLHLQYA